LTHSIRPGRRSVFASLALAALVASLGAIPVTAQPVAAAEYKVVMKKSSVRAVRLYGSSPYICTPSGFGRKARCYLRSVG
jgi:ferric-dicitrate binding protein FerR (iron transport regulator)